ncbi:MAG: SDR family oxidoreductase [Promethearchaeota archaeon]
MNKILIVGASGLTGFKLAYLAKTENLVSCTYNNRPIEIENCKMYKLDKTNTEKTLTVLKKVNPDVVIDCSALHNVDYCEKNEAESKKVNVDGTKFIAEVCKKINAKLIFLSTDYVYDGIKQSYTEESNPNPLNIYGKHKLEAEKEIIKTGIDYAIARTSLVFGWNPNELKGLVSSSGKTMNFVIWVLNKLRNGESLKIVSDQYSTPTLADNLAEFLLSLADSNTTGVFHTVGKECISRYNFTVKIAEIFNINQELITSVTSEMFKQIAKRPMNCCLDSSKSERILKIKPLTIEESLLRMKNQEEGF